MPWLGRASTAISLRPDELCRAALMELDWIITGTGTGTGAVPDEKDAERLAQRNGFRGSVWETRAGTAELKTPTLRKGSLPCVVEFRRVAEQAPVGGHSGSLYPWHASRLVDDLVKFAGMCPSGAALELTTSRFVLAEKYLPELRIL
jgi:hypothetical protein